MNFSGPLADWFLQVPENETPEQRRGRLTRIRLETGMRPKRIAYFETKAGRPITVSAVYMILRGER